MDTPTGKFFREQRKIALDKAREKKTEVIKKSLIRRSEIKKYTLQIMKGWEDAVKEAAAEGSISCALLLQHESEGVPENACWEEILYEVKQIVYPAEALGIYEDTKWAICSIRW